MSDDSQTIATPAAPTLTAVGQFIIISAHGRLVQSYTNGEMHASQEVDNVGDEERWRIFSVSQNKITLQNVRTNKWLCAEPNGRAVCDRPSPGPWEEWRVYATGDGKSVSLLGAHNMWLVAQPPGQDTQWGGEVAADRKSAGPWERFIMSPYGQLSQSGADWFDTVKRAIESADALKPISLP